MTQEQGPRGRRLVARITEPRQLALGVVVSVICDYLLWNDPHRLTNGAFWGALACWYSAEVLLFFIEEARAWATRDHR